MKKITIPAYAIAGDRPKPIGERESNSDRLRTPQGLDSLRGYGEAVKAANTSGINQQNRELAKVDSTKRKLAADKSREYARMINSRSNTEFQIPTIYSELQDKQVDLASSLPAELHGLLTKEHAKKTEKPSNTVKLKSIVDLVESSKQTFNRQFTNKLVDLIYKYAHEADQDSFRELILDLSKLKPDSSFAFHAANSGALNHPEIRDAALDLALDYPDSEFAVGLAYGGEFSLGFALKAVRETVNKLDSKFLQTTDKQEFSNNYLSTKFFRTLEYLAKLDDEKLNPRVSQTLKSKRRINQFDKVRSGTMTVPRKVA